MTKADRCTAAPGSPQLAPARKPQHVAGLQPHSLRPLSPHGFQDQQQLCTVRAPASLPPLSPDGFDQWHALRFWALTARIPRASSWKVELCTRACPRTPRASRCRASFMSAVGQWTLAHKRIQSGGTRAGVLILYCSAVQHMLVWQCQIITRVQRVGIKKQCKGEAHAFSGVGSGHCKHVNAHGGWERIAGQDP